MSRFKRWFNPTPEEEKLNLEQLNNMIQKLKDDKHCSFCVHSTEESHYEMGKYAGTDVYCNVFHKLLLSYPTGDQCLFWQLKEEPEQ